MKTVGPFEAVTAHSNDCKVADGHLLPSHFSLSTEIQNEINKFLAIYNCAVITFKELVSFREFHNNCPSFSEAVEAILREKVEGYEGMDFFEEDYLTKGESKFKVTFIEAYSTPEAIYYFYTSKEKAPKND